MLWFLAVTGKYEPNSEEDWLKCVIEISKQAVDFLENIQMCLEEIIELRDFEIFEEWKKYYFRDIPKHRIKSLFKKVLISVYSDREIPSARSNRPSVTIELTHLNER